MSENEKAETETSEAKPEGETEAKGKGFDDWLRDLSPEQLQKVQTAVNTEAGDRKTPDYGGMTDGEFRQHVSRKHGFTPRV